MNHERWEGPGVVRYETLSVAEAAALTRISRTTMYRLIKAGTIRTVNMGKGEKRIRRVVLEAWLRGEEVGEETWPDDVAIGKALSTNDAATGGGSPYLRLLPATNVISPANAVRKSSPASTQPEPKKLKGDW